MFSSVILWVTTGNREKIPEKWRIGVLSRDLWLDLGQNQGNSLIFTKIAISQKHIIWTSVVVIKIELGMCDGHRWFEKRYLGFFLFLIFLWKMTHYVPKNRSNWRKAAKKWHFVSKKGPKNQNSEIPKITFFELPKTITHTKFDLYNYYRSPDNVFLRYRDFRKNKGISLILAQIESYIAW